MTNDAPSSDAMVGIDNIVVTSDPASLNSPPMITSDGGGPTATASVAENMTAVTTVTADDADVGDVVTFSVGGTDGALFTINPMSGVLTFTAPPNFENALDAGKNNVYDITVTAKDKAGATDTQDIAITVTNVPEAPVITSNGGGPTAMVNVAENVAAVTTVTVSDDDAGSSFTFTITGGSDQGFFKIDAGGALSLNVARDFEMKVDANGDGVYLVTVTVSDGGLTDTQDLAVTITDVNEFPPDITSDGGGATAKISIFENTTAVTTVIATDKDTGDVVTYAITGGADGALFSINKMSGVLMFIAAPNFESPQDAGKNNVYDVNVTASDTKNTDTQAIEVTIANVDEAPVFTGGPMLALTLVEGVAPVTTAVAVDPEGKTPILYGLSGGADSALFSMNSAGDLVFNLPPDFETPGDANGDNVYELVFVATEGTTFGFQTVTVTIRNVNEAPTFVAGADQTVNEDAGMQTVPGFLTGITVGPMDVFTDLGTKVTFDVTNDNTALFSVQPTIDSNGQLTYAALPNASGKATVTVVAMDNGGTDDFGIDTSAPQSFTITVNGVNDIPDFTIGGNQIVNEDSGTKTVSSYLTSVSVGPADESIQTATVTVTNDNTALFSAQPSINGAGVLTFTPTANASGFATVTVKLQDNGGTAFGGVDTKIRTFTITVNPVNDAPSFAVGANQTVNEDAGAQTAMGFASSISPGPMDEAGQMVSFLVSNDNMGLFSAQPSIDAAGNLTYAFAMDAFGSAKVTVQAKDTGGVMNGGVDTSAAQFFTITANPVNDAPTFTIPSGVSGPEDLGPVSFASFLTSLVVGPANESSQKATITLTNDNSSLFSMQPFIDPAGTLTFTGAPNANGMATVTVKVQDTGGTLFGGMDTTTQTFTIVLEALNDAPSFVVPAEAATTVNTGLNTFTMFATMISAGGAADEAGQAVSFFLMNDNNALFDVQPAIDASGTLTFTVAADSTGLATVTVFAMDDGGTTFVGDVDTSDTQMFLIRVLGKNVAAELRRRRRPGRRRGLLGRDRARLPDDDLARAVDRVDASGDFPGDERRQFALRRPAGDRRDGEFDLHAGGERFRQGDRHGHRDGRRRHAQRRRRHVRPADVHDHAQRGERRAELHGRRQADRRRGRRRADRNGLRDQDRDRPGERSGAVGLVPDFVR
jgi:VCBS repeat-containing protein